MRRSPRATTARRVAVAVAAVTVALAGGAYAATTGATGTITVCVHHQNGELYRAKRCARHDAKLSWNARGLQGLAGARGLQGTTGTQGPKGDSGAQGPKGDSGAQGPAGPATGTAGGALAGSYPNPTLNVTGGPCPTGQFLTNLSSLTALTCGPTGTSAAFGQGALSSNLGAANSAFGQNALSANTSGGSNSAFGETALQHNMSATGNSAFGQSALLLDTSGGSNSAFGWSALENDTAGGNSAVGTAALQTNTSGTNNTAVGAVALQTNTSGTDNAAFGFSALQKSTTVNGSSAFGSSALLQDTTGSENTAVGFSALAGNTTGANNTALGYDANPGPTGSNNILLGDHAGFSYNTNESNNIDIGSRGTSSESNAIHIGGTNGTGASQQNTLIIPAATSTVAGTTLQITASGQIGEMTSSQRFKTDIHPLGSVSDALMRLRPVSFRYKPQYVRGQPNPLEYGLIAEDVAKVLPNLVVDGLDGKPRAVAYQELPALLLALAHQQQRQLAAQQREITAQRSEIGALRGQQRQLTQLAREVDTLQRHARR
jgi:trimeric autotransporter adhesin